MNNLGYNVDKSRCEKKIKLINKKAIAPTWEEKTNNRRARSAKLRIAERIYA